MTIRLSRAEDVTALEKVYKICLKWKFVNSHFQKKMRTKLGTEQNRLDKIREGLLYQNKVK